MHRGTTESRGGSKSASRRGRDRREKKMEEGSVSERIPDDEGHGGSGESGGAGGADEGDGSHSDESANTESDETTESEDDCTTRSKSKDAKNKKIPRTKGKMKMKNIAAVPGMDGRVRARRTRAMVEAEADAANDAEETPAAA